MRLKKCALRSPFASAWSRTALRPRAILLACLIMAFHAVRLTAQFSFVAVNDAAHTGPLQTVKVDVIHNDTILCSNYTWRIISSLNPTTEGTATQEGEKIVFTPGKNCSNRNVDIIYGVNCGGTEVTATLSVFVSQYNWPANIIDPAIACYDPVPANISFGIRQKFRTRINANNSGSSIDEHYGIDGFTVPLVGDLNGDGKPEIVIMGTKDRSIGLGKVNQTSIIVFNGQSGDLKHMAILGNSGAPSDSYFTNKTSYLNIGGSFQMGAPYHRAPSSLAIAHLDNDKYAEIIFCHAGTGKIYAFTPVFNGENITSFTKKWESSVPFKSSNTPTDRGNFGYPHPYVADLNNDGIPEIIVYNKIYNGATGALLMAWGGVDNPSTTTQYSSNSPSGTLTDNSYERPATSANATNIRGVPMTGRRPLKKGTSSYSDRDLAVPAIIDIDGDGTQEIITGIRIHKFQFNSLTD
ncbi:MAG: VCBS repeat-containing protein, partial [Tannerella sp.]|nr:VCBS repeat-containing protein [Tannerella sp.]